MTKTKAYSYLRISTDQQKVGDGIRRQMDMSREYAERHDYELVDTMSDIGISAFKGKNVTEGALGVFIDAIEAGKIEKGSVLLVESLDRLSRKTVLEAFNQFTSILQLGIGIVTLTDNQHYTAESLSANIGQLFTSLGIMIRANEESEIKSKRLRAAWVRKRKNVDQRKMTSLIPAWLEISDDKKTFHINEAKADTVRHIFKLSLDGMGIYSIARNLNENREKYPPIARVDKWHTSYISKILHSPATYGMFQSQEVINGKRTACGEPFEDYYPPVIDKDTFNLVQSRMADRTDSGAGRKGKDFSNLFSGLLKCGSCGGTVQMRGKGAGKKGRQYLRCANSLVKSGCDCPAWQYPDFESAFMQFAKEVKFSELLNEDDTESNKTNLEAQRASALKRQSELRTSYDALISNFEKADLPEALLKSLVSRSVEIEGQIETEQSTIVDLDRKIAELSLSNIDGEQEDFLAAYDEIRNSDDATKLRELRFSMAGLLKRIIDKIVVHNDMMINPWEAEYISDKLRDQILSLRNIKTQVDVESYLSKPVGKRAYVESERYFVIKFKSGTARKVQPYTSGTYMSVSERMADMKKRIS